MLMREDLTQICVTCIVQIRPDDSKTYVFCFSSDSVQYLVRKQIHIARFLAYIL